MVDYSNALKRPFSDIKKLLIAILLSVIPIISFMFTGYILDVAKTAMKKKYKLPEWRYGTNFVHGLISFVISLIYMLPFLIITMLFIVLITIFENNTAGTLITILVFVVIATLYSILIIGATMRYAETRKFGAAFEFGAIIKKTFSQKFIVALCVAGLISFLVALAVAMLLLLVPIPFVPLLVSVSMGTALSIFMYTVLGQAYAEK
ncbi:MAG: DUF4013 domain-containing protein [Candidatus Nanoarchaeia archaeon]|nr:DUF4013 domain-containing protein [Candidatus Nanoarchaeia archaeon]MDD5239558.1 DUF4013 domain-containing protein [Candidatus Nanoarchaeia archaeon]